jgi:hypothetical protein
MQPIIVNDILGFFKKSEMMKMKIKAIIHTKNEWLK